MPLPAILDVVKYRAGSNTARTKVSLYLYLIGVFRGGHFFELLFPAFLEPLPLEVRFFAFFGVAFLTDVLVVFFAGLLVIFLAAFLPRFFEALVGAAVSINAFSGRR